MQSIGISKRLLAGAYELLLLIAIWSFCTLVFVMLLGPADAGIKRLLLQLLLWLASGAYFVTCWIKSGQTPASQAWKIKLVDRHNEQVDLYCAIKRYLLASLSLLVLGLGFLWALVDKESHFLHDRILGTRWIKAD